MTRAPTVVSRLALAALCATLAALALIAASAARADSADPLFTYYASAEREGAGKSYPPPGGFEGPCGLAVDSFGDFYVSDYYRGNVDVFRPSPEYLAHLTGEDPLDGPCGLAVGATGALYVNNFHRNVVRFTPSPFPVTSASVYGAGTAIDPIDPEHPTHPTGVAVDPGTGNVYVDDRTYVAVYEPSGAPVEVGGEPLRIGPGSLKDGYGVAVSGYFGTAGYVYVPDAADNTVKVYDPATDTENPIEVIDGHETPEGHFVSLRDAAVAVDRLSGEVYVADDLQPEYYERPEAAVYAFDESGAYDGRLKYNVIDARPPGLAVDNSTTATKGRVYVTSGNSEGAAVLAYAPGALTTGVFPAPGAAVQAPGGAGAAATSAAAARSAAASETGAPEPGAKASEVTQKGKLRVTVIGKLSPRALPRSGAAPVSVSVAGRISTTDKSPPPQLKTLRIEINRHGRLDAAGLPTCHAADIQTASSARALAACRPSLVGQGRFWANIVLSGQQPYPTQGRLLLFNGARHGKPALLGQIYAPHPFATSFVIAFAVRHIAHGAYGTALTAFLPKALGNWGYVTAISLTLSRRYTYRGRRHSFISAGCPAPKGFGGVVFPLAQTSFIFAGGRKLTSTLTRPCGVRR